MVNYNINIPWETLDNWQKEYIYADPNQSCFLLTGRQVGKTTAMGIKAVELCVKHFKKGEDVLISSLTEKQSYHMLAKAIAYAVAKYPKQIATGKDKPTMHKLIFKNGTRILSYAAGLTGEGLRGFTIKKHLVDEGSRMSEEFFVAVTPMMSVVKGSMDIASTPCGKGGFFYECSKDDNFKEFFVSAEDCPRHTKEFLAGERKRMTKLQYAQEYLAVFLDELKQFFPSDLIEQNITISEEESMGFLKKSYLGDGFDKYLGVDLAGYGGDENAFVVVKKTKKDRISMIEIQTTTGDEIKHNITRDTIDRIILLDKKYDFKRIYIDDGGLGSPIFDFLKEVDDIKRKIVAINNASRSLDYREDRKKTLMKHDLYGNLLRLFENKQCQLLDHDNLRLSLKSIQYEQTETRGVKIFGNYTHITEALVRAAWCVKDKTLNIWIR